MLMSGRVRSGEEGKHSDLEGHQGVFGIALFFLPLLCSQILHLFLLSSCLHYCCLFCLLCSLSSLPWRLCIPTTAGLCTTPVFRSGRRATVPRSVSLFSSFSSFSFLARVVLGICSKRAHITATGPVSAGRRPGRHCECLCVFSAVRRCCWL